ncbi:peroxin-14, partial [Lecanoromycetidae sp. Uapishka_2]
MMREDLISSAVSFLQDPSVAASALEKRVAFLQSKNLTQEEIDLALARAEGAQPPNAPQPPPQAQYGYQAQQIRHPYGYGPWNQAPPEPPRRDWRDWFIMATVTSSVGYGLYTVAKRYVYPLIAPPTPPQLEADKASIDASFDRAFNLIEQLSKDTAELKTSETERTERLDTTLRDVDSVIEDLKTANRRQEAENRIIANEVQGLKDLVPKALEGWKASGDAKLEDLSQEMQSLKRLLENRVGKTGGSLTPTTGRGHPAPTTNGQQSTDNNPSASTNAASPTPESNTGPAAPAPGVTIPKRERAIPAWQKAAAGKSGTPSPAASGEGSATEAGV